MSLTNVCIHITTTAIQIYMSVTQKVPLALCSQSPSLSLGLWQLLICVLSLSFRLSQNVK